MNKNEKDYADYLKKDDYLRRHDWFNLSDAQRKYLIESGSYQDPDHLSSIDLNPSEEAPGYKIAEKKPQSKKVVKQPKVEKPPEPEEDDASLPPSFLKLMKMTGLKAVKDAMRKKKKMPGI